MANRHPHIETLLQCIELEEQEQVKRYSLDQQHTLKQLKAEGLALHPIVITRKGFGYADYPEISFRLAFPAETNQFKDGSAIECFCAGEAPVKGMLLGFDGRAGEFRLYAPDFPEWIEDDAVGIKLAPDQRTTTIMKDALKNLAQNNRIYRLFEQLHDQQTIGGRITDFSKSGLAFRNRHLNQSQREAVYAITQQEDMTIVHGPPGTGKTTTLTEAIIQLIDAGQKVLVAAPSNTAVDHISRSLIAKGVRLLRVGNTSKVDAGIFPFTPEGSLLNNKLQKEIKDLKIRAEAFRKMALKYKRNFGREEREQRNLLLKEVRAIREEIKKIQAYNEEKLFAEADVVAGTPIGLYDADISKMQWKTLVIDEAGQCPEPLAWCIFPLAEKFVLAGDHFQLPPTVLSYEAMKLGYDKSILEVCIENCAGTYLLNTQYRMRKAIAGFSSDYFYKGALQAAQYLENKGTHISFIDTAGSGYNEIHGSDGTSLQNEGELMVVQKLLETEGLQTGSTAFISPYAGQVAAAREVLPAGMRISTIDSFQGQEEDCIILSLVRSNDDGEIGFLKDYRRMNVAITRAKEQLFIIGDSATVARDIFYAALFEYIEKHGAYRTVWEFA